MDEKVFKTKYKYPFDIANNESMVQKNMTGIPIVTEEYEWDEKLYERKINFISDISTNNMMLPKDVYSRKLGNNNPLERTVTYLRYDDKGNLLEFKDENDVSICQIWGYNKTYLIAVLINADYSQIQNYISNIQTLSDNDTDRTLKDIGNEGALRESLNNMRNLPAFSNSQILTYTYDPLIGVTSETDARGYTIYYEYDNFNRLLHVRDEEGNIVTKNDYNYKTNN